MVSLLYECPYGELNSIFLAAMHDHCIYESVDVLLTGLAIKSTKPGYKTAALSRPFPYIHKPHIDV